MNRSFVVRHLLPIAIGALPLFMANSALPDATGPDFYRVIDVAPDDTLNMRTGPSADFPVVAEIAHDANGVANLGCTGALTPEQWSSATQAERREAINKRWCLVGFERTVGWASGRFLEEGGPTDLYDAGDPLAGLAGSEWRLTRLADTVVEAEATIAFASDGTASGNSGCNRFSGSFEEDRGVLSFGPLASTRMACPEELMDLETGFLQSLGSARKVVAHHLVMALLDDQMKVVAQFARTDWD